MFILCNNKGDCKAQQSKDDFVFLRSLSVQLDVKRSNLDGGKYLAGIEIKLDYNNSLQVLSDYLSSDSAVECYWWDCMCPQSNVQKRNVEPNH